MILSSPWTRINWKAVKPFSFLEAAYKIARTLIVTKAREEEEEAIDTEYIRGEMENITLAMKNASDIYIKAKHHQEQC